jgi:hypothetical protein
LELRQQHIQSSSLITTSINGNKDGCQNSPLRDEVFSEIQKSTSKETHAKSVKYQKYILAGTGRIAFGSHSDVGEIYHYHSASVSKGGPPPLSINPADDKFLDLEEIRFGNLSLSNKVEDLKSNGNATEVDVSGPSSSVSSSRKNKKSDSFDVSSEASKIKKKPNLSKTGTLHGPPAKNAPNPKEINKNAVPATTKTDPYGLQQPRTKPFVSSSNSAPVVGVGQTTGKVAAMARMKALGEEWPEEEELPGFSLPSSTLVSNAGLPSKDVTKEANKSLYRQQKLNVAKRKG